MGNFFSNMEQVGNTNEYSYGITWAEGLSGGLNGLSIYFGIKQINKKGLTSILLSILFITLYYVLRQKDLKIYANNDNTDKVPNIVYFTLSLVLFIVTWASDRWLKSDRRRYYEGIGNNIVRNANELDYSPVVKKNKPYYSGISEYRAANRR
jgi:hypothetical protein